MFPASCTIPIQPPLHNIYTYVLQMYEKCFRVIVTAEKCKLHAIRHAKELTNMHFKYDSCTAFIADVSNVFQGDRTCREVSIECHTSCGRTGGHAYNITNIFHTVQYHGTLHSDGIAQPDLGGKIGHCPGKHSKRTAWPSASNKKAYFKQHSEVPPLYLELAAFGVDNIHGVPRLHRMCQLHERSHVLREIVLLIQIESPTWHSH